MNATDLQKRVNLMVGAIRNGIPEVNAREMLTETLKYALFPSEEKLAKESFVKAMADRGTPVAL